MPSNKPKNPRVVEAEESLSRIQNFDTDKLKREDLGEKLNFREAVPYTGPHLVDQKGVILRCDQAAYVSAV